MNVLLGADDRSPRAATGVATPRPAPAPTATTASVATWPGCELLRDPAVDTWPRPRALLTSSQITQDHGGDLRVHDLVALRMPPGPRNSCPQRQGHRLCHPGVQGRPVCGWTGTRRTSVPASVKDRQRAVPLRASVTSASFCGFRGSRPKGPLRALPMLRRFSQFGCSAAGRGRSTSSPIRR